MLELENKRIAMVIAFRDFRDEEYFIPKQILKISGAEVETVSSSLGKAIGKLGGEAEVGIALKDFNLKDYDALLFIGGSGAQKYINDDFCHQLAKEALDENKVLGAICIAPAILAEAGVLKGKEATVWSSNMDKSAVKILENCGAKYQDKAVVVDNKIITASGPLAAKEFAEAIIDNL